MIATRPGPALGRVISIDALRGFVMFTMIYVNDLAGAPEKIVPAWMKHYHGKNGMTFVDQVFPALLFLVGMSIPFALGSRLHKGEPLWKTFLHVVVRTLSLLFIGILMVHETPDSKQLGWSGDLWVWLMFLSAIAAFCSISWPGKTTPSAKWQRTCQLLTLFLRVVGLVSLVILAFAFKDKNGRGIIRLSPFVIHTSWYGILGIIGWAYLAGAIVFLVFRGHRTALLGCMALLLCLYPAEKTGLLDNCWLEHIVALGDTLGAHGAIAVGGLLLGSFLVASETTAVWSRARFTLLFAAGCAAGALLLNGLYGISKNDATTSWCLWSCAITALLWLGVYYLCEVRPVPWIARPLAVAGQNVLLAYLLSEMIDSPLPLCNVEDWQSGFAGCQLLYVAARSVLWALLLLYATARLNRFGFRLKL
jgi:heparan-alpha-glucosaminide N-acetyltransferase